MKLAHNPATAAECMRVAFEHGVNFFDVAESHSGGQAEIDMGLAIRKHNWKRSDFVISTKIFWGGKGPNDRGLSRKHIIEGLSASLNRLQLDYVDIVYAQRPDIDTPMEETVRAFSWCIDKGMALYWGTSEWPAYLVTEAIAVAKRLGLIEPIVEQPQYNMFHRDRVEKEYLPLYDIHKLGITTWSPLASGVLTGKYNNGTIPPNARLAIQDHPVMNRLRAGFFSEEGRRKVEKVKMLVRIAQKLKITPAQLSIAWCLKNPRVSSVITGASKPSQVEENVQAIRFVHLLTDEVMVEIESVLAYIRYRRCSTVSSKGVQPLSVIDHYERPRNVGTLDKKDKSVGTGLVGAPACGDVMKLQIKVDEVSGKITDVKFKTFGCGSAIASSSYMSELVNGMTLDEAGNVKNTTIAKELSLPPVKLHCSMLAEDAIKSAISDYKKKRMNTQ
ncbi:hypothetical protein INT44_007798 [Umbelopsis vinacea]|uniref:Iron-sulfur cluster assembly protein n=1 Tax=Umbelopsis vinacea TaxID=44442 RepID=A0A8H7UA41_9FUNG|nr:hypothetical protein INT44_007798 [Umbelopsis vinacea]